MDEMDAAMERRWAKIELRPNPRKVNEFLQQNGFSRTQRGLIVEFFQALQADSVVGHAFFRRIMDVDAFERLWNHQLVQVIRKQHRYDPDLVERTRDRFDQVLAKLRQPESTEADAAPGVTAPAQVDEPIAETNLPVGNVAERPNP